jgi:hypothetical protein
VRGAVEGMSVSVGCSIEAYASAVLLGSYLSNASCSSGYYGFDHCDVCW